MSQKLIPMDDAAEQFGVSKEKLNELREAGKVRAYRDGSSWKFRSDDLEKALADETPDAASSDLSLDPPDEPSDPADSILVSDDADADAAGRPPSTVIGKPSAESGDTGSDLELSLEGEGEGSDVKLAAGASDILAASTSGSHVLDDPSVTPSGSGTGKFEDLDEIEIDLETESSQILSAGEAGVEQSEKTGPGSQASDLQLVDSDVGSQQVDLPEDEDDEMVLGSEQSDITLSGGDSGINIVQPSDSGLELDEIPLDLGGSSISSLDLGGDAGQEEDLVLEEAGGEEDDQTEDDFLLTPLEGDSEESSSQVIALDSEEDLAEVSEEDAGMLTEEPAPVVVDDQLAPADLTPVDAPAGMSAGPGMVPDTSFSGANVALLALCILVLLPCGVMAFDLLRNMWSWNETSTFGGGLVEAVNFFN